MTDHGQTLRQLHAAPEILVVVNVWDVASAKVAAGVPGTKAIATASHGIAATLGYEDGSTPVGEMLEMVGRIVRAVDVPVTADLESGYGDPADTIRRACGLGVVGANLEDEMKPLSESVAAVEAAVEAAAAEGVTFSLNARTDAYLKGVPDAFDEAVRRGKAFLDAGATSVFVPGMLDVETVRALVTAIGGPVSVIGLAPSPSVAEYEQAGACRVSFGPVPQRIALTAYESAVAMLLAGGGLPEGIRPLN